MKTKSLEETFDEIREESEGTNQSKKWWAGTDSQKLSNDLFLGHSDVGLYQIKSYMKNSLESKGIGAKITSNLDEEIEQEFKKSPDSMFGVLPRKVGKRQKKNLKGLLENKDFSNEKDFFDQVMKALEVNIKGSLTHSNQKKKGPIKELRSKFEEEQKELNEEFEKIVNEDQVYKSYL
ncbi:MAG: hypothetical protein BTN85_1280 [Candidatus Methanohalarchaeum thermophilum]|uniref:Uncharacterized protein n=1 Tax=Methanohalarchaeum thermophilum TaxID=1903181 RepID=A0A1Q6DRV8_METT1|nr:MAG: hypothetical protein BTN85_1749 [Candidatus Methanohalarchaeum thermophilum]OKY78778.1 MAG: hypothetical protein BTN85_1280 [Candidatus Methanohalarchaeum thermophilum]